MSTRKGDSTLCELYLLASSTCHLICKLPVQVKQDASVAVAESLKKQEAAVNSAKEQFAEAGASCLRAEAQAQELQGEAKASACCFAVRNAAEHNGSHMKVVGNSEVLNSWQLLFRRQQSLNDGRSCGRRRRWNYHWKLKGTSSLGFRRLGTICKKCLPAPKKRHSVEVKRHLLASPANPLFAAVMHLKCWGCVADTAGGIQDIISAAGEQLALWQDSLKMAETTEERIFTYASTSGQCTVDESHLESTSWRPQRFAQLLMQGSCCAL